MINYSAVFIIIFPTAPLIFILVSPSPDIVFSDISKSFKAEIEELKNKYIKYENDLSVPFETRDKYTKLLYEEDLKLISKYNIPRNFLPKYLSNTIKNKPFYFRPGVKKFITFIIEHKILFIIISKIFRN